jgi:hypothetical protein
MPTHASRLALALASVTAMLFIVSLGAVPEAQAKKGKIHACAAKKGPDKGTMRWVRKGKCHKGEKAVKWNKRGPAGTAGPQGQPGPAGPSGEGANQQALDALRLQLEQQTARITDLETQLGTLSTEFAAFQTVACAQLSTLTDQTNLIGTALDGIGLGGTIPPLLDLVNPGAPTALPGFSC